MKVILLLLCVIISNYNCFGQSNRFRLHGTLIIGAISQDGILIASDSRIGLGDIRDGVDTISSGYVDSAKKIFVINSYAIALAGTLTYGNVFFKKILNDFELLKTPYTTPESFLRKLVAYMENTYGPLDSKTSVMCVGYYKGKPMLSAFQMNKYTIINQIGYFSNKGDKLNILKLKFHYESSGKDVEMLLEEQINKYSKYYPETKNDIGGEVSILKLLPNKKVWVKGLLVNTKSWNYYTDFVKDYFGGKVKATFVRPEFKVIVEDSMKEKFRLYSNGDTLRVFPL